MLLPFLASLSLLVPTVTAGEFVNTWVTTAFEDTNLLAGPEYYSPAPNFVERGNRTFFEDYESRYSDDITASNLVLYRKDEGFWKGWYSEAAFVIRFQPYLNPDQSKEGARIEDDGSYVRLYRVFDGDDRHNFSITGYAIDASRFRLGYSWDLSWGGREIFAFDPKATPGVRFQYQRGGSYAFAGAKTSVGDETQSTGDKRNEAFFGLLAGGGVEALKNLRIEGGVGSFRQGQFTNVDRSSARYGESIQAMGFAGQISWRSTARLDFIQSADLKLYRNAPDMVRDTYISHTQLEGMGMLVQAEVNYLNHNLLDIENTNSTLVEKGLAGDMQTRFVLGSTELNLDFVYKDLAFIVFNIPGVNSNFAIPDSFLTTPQLYGRVKVSHYFESARVAPSLGVGLMQPASYSYGQSTYVVVSEEERQAVPTGYKASPILGAIAGIQVDASKSLVLVGEFLFTRDDNRSNAEANEEEGTTHYVQADWRERTRPGFNLMMRARF
jgi:hypothetical protein